MHLNNDAPIHLILINTTYIGHCVNITDTPRIIFIFMIAKKDMHVHSLISERLGIRVAKYIMQIFFITRKG
ncbi:hypothetical protein HZS_8117 [Henneguya salminicola]|nr:hypothetical protein HZS_8117 [Henneguya salminicola]